MTKRDDALAKLRDAKARFEDSLSLARYNLTPAKLGKRAATKTKRGVTGAVQAQPIATVAIGLGLLALLFRKPLAGLVRRIRKDPHHD